MLRTCSGIKHFGRRAHTVFASAEKFYGLGPLHAQIVEIFFVKGISACVSPRIQYVLAVTMERQVELKKIKAGDSMYLRSTACFSYKLNQLCTGVNCPDFAHFVRLAFIVIVKSVSAPPSLLHPSSHLSPLPRGYGAWE